MIKERKIKRTNRLVHSVECMDCGKKARIEIETDGTNKHGWVYQGKHDINTCQTNKYFYQIPDGIPFDDFKNWKKVPNKCYDPKVKRKYVEMWSCAECEKEVVK